MPLNSCKFSDEIVPPSFASFCVRIFVSEFISSGAMAGMPLPDSLLREGQAMLSAVIGDVLAIPGCNVATTLDRRITDRLNLRSGSVDTRAIDDANAEQIAFDRLVTQADATLVIAPETDGVLARRVQRVHDLGAKSLNCRPSAIEICGDKLQLADHLTTRGIPTIPTHVAPPDETEPWDRIATACVMKPRDGAGSWLTFVIPYRDSIVWKHAKNEFAIAAAADRAIIQPWIAGSNLSVGCLCDDSGQREVLPIACQHLSRINFQYLGGTIPAEIPPETVVVIEQLVHATCATITGLRGYIGIDLLLPDADPKSPLIVEINPRLTTSYIGYRQLCEDNIAERLLQGNSQALFEPLKWKPESVSFQVCCPTQPSFSS